MDLSIIYIFSPQSLLDFKALLATQTQNRHCYSNDQLLQS